MSILYLSLFHQNETIMKSTSKLATTSRALITIRRVTALEAFMYKSKYFKKSDTGRGGLSNNTHD